MDQHRPPNLLRLERDAWSTVKLVWQETKAYTPPPPASATPPPHRKYRSKGQASAKQEGEPRR